MRPINIKEIWLGGWIKRSNIKYSLKCLLYGKWTIINCGIINLYCFCRVGCRAGSSDAGWWWCSSEQCLSVEGFHCGTCLCKWQRMRKKEREADRALTKCWLKCQNLDSNWLYNIYTTMYLFLFSITHYNIQHYNTVLEWLQMMLQLLQSWHLIAI